MQIISMREVRESCSRRRIVEGDVARVVGRICNRSVAAVILVRNDFDFCLAWRAQLTKRGFSPSVLSLACACRPLRRAETTRSLASAFSLPTFARTLQRDRCSVQVDYVKGMREKKRKTESACIGVALRGTYDACCRRRLHACMRTQPSVQSKERVR